MDINQINIRELSENDLDQLPPLMDTLGYKTSKRVLTKRLNTLKSKEGYNTYVATYKEQIVAFMGLVNVYMWENDGFFIKIQALVVKEGFQRQGIGRLMIDYAKNIGKAEGAAYLLLNSGNRPGREAAHQFYPKMGFQIKSTLYKFEL
jgi:GNAT superfamily N-acetyltransferase